METSSLSRGDVFEPLVAVAKARTVTLIERGSLRRDDGLFLLRALIDLESDGVELFEAARRVDSAFYDDVEAYVLARVGALTTLSLVFDPAAAESIAALAASEGPRVRQLLGLPGAGLARTAVDRAVNEIVDHPEVNCEPQVPRA